MTKIQKLLRTLKANSGRKISQAILGKIRIEIRSWNVSTELKRSAYRHALRVDGYTDESHINTLANGYFR